MKLLDRLAVLALFGLLTWLLLKGLDPADERLREGLGAIDNFAAGESALHRDVLRSHAGLLRDYDPLQGSLERMAVARDTIVRTLHVGGGSRDAVALTARLTRQETLTERFKSSNALLQNSLAYFALFSSRVAMRTTNVEVKRGVDRLSGVMLNLSIDGSAAVQTDVDAEIEKLSARCSYEGCGPDVTGLLAHARLLRHLLPEIERTIEQLVGSGDSHALGRLRHHFLVEEQAADRAAGRFRLLLYITSLLLLYMLVRWGLQMRAHGAALQRQMALEHAVSRMSTRLIAAPAEELEAVAREELGALGQAVGATHVYFLPRHEAKSYNWPEDAAPLPPSSLEALARLAVHGGEHVQGVAPISRRALAEGSPERLILEHARLESCFCVLRPGEVETANILLLGFAAGNGNWEIGQLAVLSAALDAISLALERATLEAERTRLEAQLAHAHRMETVGAFASGIAHNFNNLLGAIGGHAEMATDAGAGERLEPHLEQIRLSVERGRQLVHSLLSYGRRQENPRHPVRLDALVEESCGLARAALDASHRLDLRTGAEDAVVIVDAAQLQQVILNLCNNAAQAMPDGGTIRVLTQRRGDYAAVTVADDGCGIAPTLLQKIYEPFFTTRPSGTGLGLSTARDIIAEEQGVLSLESEVGIGTRATILLPVATTQAVPRLTPVPSITHGEGETILYLAEDRGACLSGEEMLAALGYEPAGFTSAEAAGAALIERPECFDALIAGGVPLDDSLECLLVQARRLAPTMPRILGVARTDDLAVEFLARTGVSAVVRFPLDARETMAALRTAMAAPSRHPEKLNG